MRFDLWSDLHIDGDSVETDKNTIRYSRHCGDISNDFLEANEFLTSVISMKR